MEEDDEDEVATVVALEFPEPEAGNDEAEVVVEFLLR